MSEKLAIAHIIASADLGWGGPSRVIREMTAALADRGHRVVVFSTDAAPGRVRASASMQAPFDPRVEHRVFRSDLVRPPFPSAAMALAVVREARGFDIAHVHGLFNAPSSAALLALRAARVPFVVRPCGMLDPWSLQQRAGVKAAWWRYLDGPSVRAAGAVQCSTPHELRSVEAALAQALGSRHPRLVECPQGVGLLPAPNEASAPHPRPYILFLGRIAEKKGLLPLVRAIAQPTAPDCDLVVVGPSEHGHAREVSAAITQLGLGGRVHLVGPIFDGAAKARWYEHALAFALPSSDENFGITLVEAARHGVPLLVSPEVGLAEAIAHDGAGLVVKPLPDSIAAGLTVLVGPGREAFRAGAIRLGARFAWPERAAQLESVYREVLAEAGRR